MGQSRSRSAIQALGWLGVLASALLAFAGAPVRAETSTPAMIALPAPLTPEERLVLTAAVQGAPGEGLPGQAVGETTPDSALIRAALRYAAWQHGARVANPRAVVDDWGLRAAPYDAAADFAAARAAGRLAEWRAGLSPPTEAYRRLAAERIRYAAMVEAGGWEPLAAGPGLTIGDTGPRVAALRRRLVLEGYAAQGDKDDAPYDAALAEQVSLFQTRHDLASDGRVGPGTLVALNVSARDRLAQIDLNLERERWAPRDTAPDRIEVNIASADLVYYSGGAPTLTMRTVVGKPTTRTPMFAAAVQRIVFNPPWTVPGSIARNELLPRERAHPGYLASRHVRVVGGQLVQSPGPDAALGVLKFDFPSPYGVYLHDTPNHSVFRADNRAVSHGCVRLDEPRALAVALLSRQGWSAAQVAAGIAAGRTRAVALDQPMPVLVAYRTAAAGEDGAVRFHRDVYGWDARLARTLAGM